MAIAVRNPSREVRRAFGIKVPRGGGDQDCGVWVFESPLNLEKLEDWIGCYHEGDGDRFYACVRRLRAPWVFDAARDKHRAHLFVDQQAVVEALVLAWKDAKYEGNQDFEIIRGLLRSSKTTTFGELFCSELVAAVLQQVDVLSYSIPQADVMPDDFADDRLAPYFYGGARLGTPVRITAMPGDTAPYGGKGSIAEARATTPFARRLEACPAGKRARMQLVHWVDRAVLLVAAWAAWEAWQVAGPMLQE